MKILELRFKNLNSLYGEWKLDFTNPEYVSNGIFALTGPTGSGKSTILDAICLALYGGTPRLGKIGKKSNEIMSRHTGECHAEVVFQSQKGRFRCFWSQHRARKKAHGALQAPHHEIAEAGTSGDVIESMLSRTAPVIEEKTGMDFNRFTQSSLLAQGSFDSFLRAGIEQKSEILEQITGTEVYSEISVGVHERERAEKEKLKLLEHEISGIAILDSEQEKEIQQDLEAKQQQKSEFSKKQAQVRDAITWLKLVEGLEIELKSLSEESQKLELKLESFKPDRNRLELAQKAADLDGVYARVEAARKQQNSAQEALKSQTQELPILENSAKEKAKGLGLAEQQVFKIKENLKSETVLIRQVRSLDQKIEDQNRRVCELDKRLKKEAKEIDAKRKSKRKADQRLNKALGDLAGSERYLSDNARDHWLVSGLAGVEEQFQNLLTKEKEIAQKLSDRESGKTDLQKAVEKLKECTELSATRKQDLETAVEKLKQGERVNRELLGDRLLREFRTEKDNLQRESEFRKEIMELKDYRSNLEDGSPCPLCGANEHPYAMGNIPVLSETQKKIKELSEQIQKIENHEAELKKLEATVNQARLNLTNSENDAKISGNSKKVADSNLAKLDEALKTSRSELEGHKHKLSAKIQPLGITEIPDSDFSSLLEKLQSRLKKWQDQTSKKEKITKGVTDLESELKRLTAVIETQENALDEIQKTLNLAKKELAESNLQRQEFYGDKNPDDEERSMGEALNVAELAEKQARSQQDIARQKFKTAKTNLAALNEEIETRSAELRSLEAGFITALKASQFSDEKQFCEARLSMKARGVLSETAKGLDEKQADLNARQNDRRVRLANEIGKKITDRKPEELEPELKAIEADLLQYGDLIASLNHKLKENNDAKASVKERHAALEAQKKECSRWGKLHGLIGSSDGKKYRNFAQGLTFELMISHANRQLEKMTDRYLLVHHKEEPLELNVIDNYQAGEIRSSKNLSGGESFIVSLTLALGLSKMASRKVRVDSLFLDEGFGTLDEDALELALETLSSLQQDGKLIGVISHVPALKERISTQISIAPISGGKSALTGPGCSEVEKA